MSIDRLRAAAALVPDPQLSQWLRGACRKLAAGMNPALALDLAGTGALRERNRLLVQAATLLILPPDATLWTRARTLAAEIDRHTLYPRMARGPLYALIAAAAGCAKLPSVRQLYGILQAAQQEASDNEIVDAEISRDAA